MSEDFAAAYETHVWDVYGFFAYRVANRGDAEDLTQQTFEKALRAWASFDPQRAPIGVWLMAIARNVLIDHYRTEKSTRHTSIEPLSEGGPGVERPHSDLEISPDLASALDSLPIRNREVIALRFGADLLGRQIAELTGLSVANVQQILSRSLRKLRAALDGPVPSPEDMDNQPDNGNSDRQRQQ